MAANFNQELINYLRECKVCIICQLRYLKARGNEYIDIKKTFENLNVTYKADEEEDAGLNTEGPDSKKQKLETTPSAVCPQCLGLFTEKVQNELIESIINSNIGKYDYNGIVIAITTPVDLYVRQLVMWYALLDKFPENVIAHRSPDVPIKEAAKLILNPIICKKLNKKYDVNGVSINIYLKHHGEDSILQKFEELHDDRMRKNYAYRRVPISRTIIETQYNPESVAFQVFTKFFDIPLPISEETLFLDKVELIGPTVYVAGRYQKYSRNLSHTPWILNGKRIKDDSIEEILIRNIAPHFNEGNSKVIFMSSGREDVDVRCLGRGRPFLLEIPNSYRPNLTRAQAYAMEVEIKKSEKVSARHIQVVSKEEQIFIKTGEEHKRKHYRALCRLKEPVTLEMLHKLNSTKEFVIQQRTPLRVLHRRPLLTRPRTIYSIKAYADENRNDVLILDIVTQAGTYVKELVHGEFGRTEPSIATILNRKIDIIALDVLDIDFDWPKSIDNSLPEEETLRNENVLESKDCTKENIDIDDNTPSTSRRALENLEILQKTETFNSDKPSTSKDTLTNDNKMGAFAIEMGDKDSNPKNIETLLTSKIENESKNSSKAEELVDAGHLDTINLEASKDLEATTSKIQPTNTESKKDLINGDQQSKENSSNPESIANLEGKSPVVEESVNKSGSPN